MTLLEVLFHRCVGPWRERNNLLFKKQRNSLLKDGVFATRPQLCLYVKLSGVQGNFYSLRVYKEDQILLKCDLARVRSSYIAGGNGAQMLKQKLSAQPCLFISKDSGEPISWGLKVREHF